MASNAIGGGSVDAEGFLKHFLHLYKVGYTRALNVTQRAAGANMSVDVNIDTDSYGGALFVTASAVPYFGYTNAVINSTVTTADPTNPRKDIVVAYIDLSLITTGTANNLGAFKIKVVPGTAAASPSDPSGATIQASVGAGNPYVQLARVSLTAAMGSVVNANITDLRTPAALAMPYLWGGASNTKGHLVPNQADGTVVTTTDTNSVSTAMLATKAVTAAKTAVNGTHDSSGGDTAFGGAETTIVTAGAVTPAVTSTVILTVMGTWQSDQANNAWDLKFKEGATLLKTISAYNDSASQRKYFCASYKVTGVTAAAHTYSVTGTRTVGAGTHIAYTGVTIRVEVFAE